MMTKLTGTAKSKTLWAASLPALIGIGSAVATGELKWWQGLVAAGMAMAPLTVRDTIRRGQEAVVETLKAADGAAYQRHLAEQETRRGQLDTLQAIRRPVTMSEEEATGHKSFSQEIAARIGEEFDRRLFTAPGADATDGAGEGDGE